MYESGNGRGTRHRVGEPDLERELRALAEESAEQKHSHAGRGLRRIRLHDFCELRKVGRPERAPTENYAEQKAEIAYAVYYERLFGRRLRRLRRGVLRYQRVGRKPDEFPEHKHHEQI